MAGSVELELTVHADNDKVITSQGSTASDFHG